jgi:hypothetical protein
VTFTAGTWSDHDNDATAGHGPLWNPLGNNRGSITATGHRSNTDAQDGNWGDHHLFSDAPTHSPTYSPTDEVVACTTPEVTCSFTIDNSVWKVYYNDQDITSTVTGDLHNWGAAKTLNFTPVAGAALAISGYEWSTSGGQGREHTSGLLISCTQGSATDIIYGHSSDWSWHSFSSDDNEGAACSSAHGGNYAGCHYPTEASFATDWYKANGPSGVSPTVSNSAFSMTSAGYSEKIWDGGKRFGAFRVATPADVCHPAP